MVPILINKDVFKILTKPKNSYSGIKKPRSIFIHLQIRTERNLYKRKSGLGSGVGGWVG